MHDATDQPDPIDKLRAAIDKCQPDEAPLRELVIAKLRKNASLLKAIANADEPSYEGSIETIRAFLSTKVWPEKDHGWVDETCSLARWGYWYSKASRPSYARKADGVDRPNERISLEVLCASVLLADSARHAIFSNSSDSEPGPDTCFAIVDIACRLGGPWPEAASRFLADHALWGAKNKGWVCYDDVLLATRDIALPLAILAAWRSVKEDARLPVHDLFEAINESTIHHGVTDDRWHEPITCIKEEVPRVIKATILDPVTNSFPEATRTEIERFCNRFIG